MVSQGSLHESNGIMPDWPYEWDSSTPGMPTAPHVEFYIEEDLKVDEDLVYEVQGFPPSDVFNMSHFATGVECLVSRHIYKMRDMVARLEIESQELEHRVCELATSNVQLALERDNRIAYASCSKICCCLLALILLVCVVLP